MDDSSMREIPKEVVIQNRANGEINNSANHHLFGCLNVEWILNYSFLLYTLEGFKPPNETFCQIKLTYVWAPKQEIPANISFLKHKCAVQWP